MNTPKEADKMFEEEARKVFHRFIRMNVTVTWPSEADAVEIIAPALAAQDRAGYERGLEEAAMWHDKQRAAALTEARNDQLKDIDTPMYRVAKHHRDSATTIRALKVKP